MKGISWKLTSECDTQINKIDLNDKIILLEEQKDQIKNYSQEIWKKARWINNPYDFKIVGEVINRAFYKYWEIITTFSLLRKNDLVLHCCESPGGFIQGTLLKRGDTHIKDKADFIIKKSIYSFSLKKGLFYSKYINNKKSVCISYGEDGTGDINNWNNIEWFNKRKLKFDLITADGGLQDLDDYNKELQHQKIILSQLFFIIQLQKEGGNSFLKVFETYSDFSYTILQLLYECYENVYAYKPLTSRPTNSEKYIICKNFKKSPSKEIFENLSRGVLIEINPIFRNVIDNINNDIIDLQLNNIKRCLNTCEKLVKEEKIMLQREEKFEEWKKIFSLTL